MLSRVADSLYWMSRYAERAENITRMLDVNQQLLLDIPADRSRELEKDWFPLLDCFGEGDAFSVRYRKATARRVTEYLTFNKDQPNSIASCLAAARENGRVIRDTLPTEMWEQINRTHLWFQSRSARQFFERNYFEFFQRLKKTLQLFQGITDSTMFHGEGWEFIQIGKFLERAEKSTRVLDEKYHLFREGKNASPNDLLLQWLAVLRSCSARRNYVRLYPGPVQPMRVTELLLLNESLPRSARFCVARVDQSLRRLSGVAAGRYSNEAEKWSGRLLSNLTFTSIEEIWSQGLHTAMDDLQIQLNRIGQGIFESYINQDLTSLQTPVPTFMPVPQ